MDTTEPRLRSTDFLKILQVLCVVQVVRPAWDAEDLQVETWRQHHSLLLLEVWVNPGSLAQLSNQHYGSVLQRHPAPLAEVPGEG